MTGQQRDPRYADLAARIDSMAREGTEVYAVGTDGTAVVYAIDRLTDAVLLLAEVNLLTHEPPARTGTFVVPERDTD